jgi:hypothetical protein
LNTFTSGGADWTIGGGTNNLLISRSGGGTVQLGSAGVTVNLIPTTDDTATLGTTSARWADTWTNLINGAAYCETNLLTGEDKTKGSIAAFEEGQLFSWKGGSLTLSSVPYDPMVQAVAHKKGGPIVLGAEPILVIGPVSEGDYLVASSTPGYAMRGEPSKIVPGCVIAQAMESFSGEKGKIKAMIRKF